MDNKTIERRIDFEVPNSLELKEDLWEKKPVGFLVEEITLYGTLVSALPLILMIFFAPVSLPAAVLLLALMAGINVGAYYLKKTIINKHWEKQLNYRKEKVPMLVELLASKGYSLPETEQLSLTITMKSDFKVLNQQGVTYRTYGLAADENSISTSFFLADFKAKEELHKSELEKRIQNITASYEAENGLFATSELREAFMLGVSQTLR
jgi:hypothetical protein